MTTDREERTEGENRRRQIGKVASSSLSGTESGFNVVTDVVKKLVSL